MSFCIISYWKCQFIAISWQEVPINNEIYL